MLKRLNSLAVFMFVFFSSLTSVFADGPLARLRQEMKSQEAENIGWGILSPALKIVTIVFFVLGIIAIIVAVGYLLIRAIKMIFGKGDLGKREIGKAFTVLLIGILVSGGSWLGFVELGNKVIVEPVNGTIIEESGGQQGNEGEQNTQKENKPK
jgi:hypothetical protein